MRNPTVLTEININCVDLASSIIFQATDKSRLANKESSLSFFQRSGDRSQWGIFPSCAAERWGRQQVPECRVMPENVGWLGPLRLIPWNPSGTQTQIKGPFTCLSSSEILVGKLDGGISANLVFRQTWQNCLPILATIREIFVGKLDGDVSTNIIFIPIDVAKLFTYFSTVLYSGCQTVKTGHGSRGRLGISVYQHHLSPPHLSCWKSQEQLSICLIFLAHSVITFLIFWCQFKDTILIKGL